MRTCTAALRVQRRHSAKLVCCLPSLREADGQGEAAYNAILHCKYCLAEVQSKKGLADAVITVIQGFWSVKSLFGHQLPVSAHWEQSSSFPIWSHEKE